MTKNSYGRMLRGEPNKQHLSNVPNAMFGNLEGDESKRGRGDESSREESRDAWLFSILFGCF